MKKYKRKYCPSCGYVIQGYDSRCPKCKKDLISYRQERRRGKASRKIRKIRIKKLNKLNNV